MTFGGVQEFTRKPSTAFTDDDGNFAGIVHLERGVTYALFQGAGHTYVPAVVLAIMAAPRSTASTNGLHTPFGSAITHEWMPAAGCVDTGERLHMLCWCSGWAAGGEETHTVGPPCTCTGYI
ncbi:hypothetical protein GGX14DRAFT_672377 [Mycena pura]|uniref:Uncharacterized protein n=1 Tax=Mycena pura TaxID=153505 RepID=A0AAD6V0J8_9AGAR|nr:hypothetical protein GGX14DRAFT_672377 [Mycena pura]